VSMRSRSVKIFTALAVMAAIGLGPSLVYAQSYDPEQDLPTPTLLQKRLNKLGRGISNFLFGWSEIPAVWYQKMQQGKPLTYLLTTAPVLGTTKAVMRTGTGVFEVFTFYTTYPVGDYEPILEPEYIF